MVKLAGLLVSLFTLLGSQAINAQQIQAEFDRSSIAENETVTLTLAPLHAGINVGNARPDLSPLQANFEILRTTSSTKAQHGEEHSRLRFFVTLAPKRKGVVEVAPLQWNEFKTNPLRLEVRGSDAARAQKETLDMFIEHEIVPHKSYVQQEVLYTVRVFSARGSPKGSISRPAPLETDVYPLADKRSSTELRGNRRFSVMEWQFAMFPQKSGMLRVPPVIFSASTKSSGNVLSLEPQTSTGSRVRLATDEVDLVIEGKPADFTGATWLPAQDLSIKEHFAQTSLKVGEPANRTIRIDARGLTGNQLPELIMPVVDGLNQYPDQASTKTTPTKTGVTGTREQNFALVPTRPGTYTLPEVRLQWWDIIAERDRVAIVAPRTLTVLSDSGSNSEPGHPNALPNTVRDTHTNEPQEHVVPDTAQANTNYVHIWQGLSGALLVLWLTTAVCWWRTVSVKNAGENDVQENGDTNNTRRAREQFINACANRDAARARSALSDWLSRVLQVDAGQHGLTSMATRLNDSALLENVKRLDATLYASTADATWDPHSLMQTSEKAVATFVAKRSTTTNTYGLEPLYPPYRRTA